ncbi:GTPase-activating protein [Savitreella phatthalungensis]
MTERLTRLLKAYALYDPAVGYVQGLHLVAAVVLIECGGSREEDAFTTLVALMKRHDLRSLYLPEMPGLHRRLYQFDRLLEERIPHCHVHLVRLGITSSMYASQWLLTLFASNVAKLGPSAVSRIYDLVVLDGLVAILRLGVALVERNAQKILSKTKMEDLLDFLKEHLFDAYQKSKLPPADIPASSSATGPLDVKTEAGAPSHEKSGATSPSPATTPASANPPPSSAGGFFGGTTELDLDMDALIADAAAVVITDTKLDGYRKDYESAVKEQAAKEAEALELRTSNVTLQASVRRLEEELEKLNTEHIELANELVSVKVARAKVDDENESLRTTVDDLKRIVDKQPQEVELKFKEQLDEQAQTSRHVAAENRKLQDQLAAIEQELINLKLTHANQADEHEKLQQKWETLRKSLA